MIQIKRTIVLTFLLIIGFTTADASNVVVSDSTQNIVTKFDAISYQWDFIAENLQFYEGLSTYCINPAYRDEVLKVLEDVHHYDTLVYNKLKALSLQEKNHEIIKTVHQIEELESEYGIEEFSKFMNIECRERNKIEKSRSNLQANLGQESYNGQQQLIACTLSRYIHHVTFLVDHIRKHIHHLHLEND